MALTDSTARRIVQGFMPIQITLAAAVSMGDLLGYDSGWKLADANAGIPAVLIAGVDGASGAKITAFPAALVDGVTGATAGADIYLSDTAGNYSATKSATSEQKLGVSLSATEMFVWLHRFAEKFTIQRTFAHASIANIFFIAPFRCRITKIQEIHETKAGQAGTLQIERLQGTEAITEGDQLLVTTIALGGTDDTVQTPTLHATPATLILEVGDRLCFELTSGASTTLANACITVELERA